MTYRIIMIFQIQIQIYQGFSLLLLYYFSNNFSFMLGMLFLKDKKDGGVKIFPNEVSSIISEDISIYF